MNAQRIFSFAEACELVDILKDSTAAVDERVRSLRERLAQARPGTPRATKLAEWINTAINQWADEVLELGATPKGLWTVDFDSGEGYYFCWKLDEEDLAHFHLYEEGFAGRKPLTDLHRHTPAPLSN